MIIPGTKLSSMPIALHKVRDIEAFEGPVLSEFRATSGDTYLYLWCDQDDKVNRWLVFRVPERDLIRYTHKAITLRKLVEHPSDGYYFIVDTDKDGQSRSVAIAQRSEVPEGYLPGAQSFHEPELSVRTGLDRTRPILIKGNWGIEDFALFPRRYSNVYAFLYVMGGGGTSALPAPYEYSFEQGRGFPIAAFFRGLRQFIPKLDRPSVQAVQYASPGFIKFKLDPAFGDAVVGAVQRATQDGQGLQGAYESVRSWYLSHSLVTAVDQKASLQKLVTSLGFIQFDRIETVLATPSAMAAVTLSYTRFLNGLAKYVKDERAEFLAGPA